CATLYYFGSPQRDYYAMDYW
nr:immunoglobulin heavy chain junction region [Mus musculus]